MRRLGVGVAKRLQLNAQGQPDASQDAPHQGREQRNAHAVDDLAQNVLHPIDVLALSETVSQSAHRHHEADHSADQAEQNQGIGHRANHLNGCHQPHAQRGGQQIRVNRGALLVAALAPQLGEVVCRYPLRVAAATWWQPLSSWAFFRWCTPA